MPLNQTAIDSLMQIREFYQYPTEVNDAMLVGYSYNLDINSLAISNDEIEDYFSVGIPKHKAEKLLKLETYRLESQLDNLYGWFNIVDDVTKFVTIAAVFTVDIYGKLESHPKLCDYLAKGKYGDASNYLTKLKVNSKIINILKTGRFR